MTQMIFLEEGAWVWLHLNHSFVDHDLRKVSLPWFGSVPETIQLTLESPDHCFWILKFTRGLNEDGWLWWIYSSVEECWCHVGHSNFPLMNLTHEKGEFEGCWLRGWSILVFPWDDLLESLGTESAFGLAPWARTYDPSWLNDRRGRDYWGEQEFFVIADLIWSAEYLWRSLWHHSWRMRPWSNSSWLNFLMVCVDLILTDGEMISLIFWMTAATSADSIALDFFVILFLIWPGCWSDCWFAAEAELAVTVEHDSPGGIWNPRGWGVPIWGAAGWGVEVDVRLPLMRMVAVRLMMVESLPRLLKPWEVSQHAQRSPRSSDPWAWSLWRAF